MTDYEIIDRLCSVNSLLMDIVREQEAIIKQYGIEETETDEDAQTGLARLYGMRQAAESENNTIEAELRRNL